MPPVTDKGAGNSLERNMDPWSDSSKVLMYQFQKFCVIKFAENIFYQVKVRGYIN